MERRVWTQGKATARDGAEAATDDRQEGQVQAGEQDTRRTNRHSDCSAGMDMWHVARVMLDEVC